MLAVGFWVDLPAWGTGLRRFRWKLTTLSLAGIVSDEREAFVFFHRISHQP